MQCGSGLCISKRSVSNTIIYSLVLSSTLTRLQWTRVWITGLHEMESLPRQLIHYGKRVTDDDYAETLLGHVAHTSRCSATVFRALCSAT